MTKLALGLLLAGIAAQTSGAAGASPLDPNEQANPLTYISAFSRYRPFADAEPQSWRDVNDTVARVGWHAGALSERAQSGTANQPGSSGQDPHASHQPSQLPSRPAGPTSR